MEQRSSQRLQRFYSFFLGRMMYATEFFWVLTNDREFTSETDFTETNEYRISVSGKYQIRPITNNEFLQLQSMLIVNVYIGFEIRGFDWFTK